MKTDKKFIYTDSEESAEQLKKLGFKLLCEREKTWLFENNMRISFENIKNVAFTNKMNFSIS